MTINPNKHILLLSLIVYCLLSFSSIHALSQPITTINISVKDLKTSGFASELFIFERIIPLETRDNCLINSIDKIKITDSLIFIYDSRSFKVLSFSMEGHFIRQIGQSGKGPGEYIELQDFDINPETKMIYLLDIKAIHQYNFKGEFIRSYKTDFISTKIMLNGPNEFLFYGGRFEHRLLITDAKMKSVKKFFPFSELYMVDNLYPFNKINTSALLHLPTIDTIYTIKNCIPEPYLFFNFNGKNFTYNDFKKLSDRDKQDVFNYQRNSNKYIRLMGIIPCGDYFYISLNYSENNYIGIYNRKTNNKKIISRNNINNDIFTTFIPLYPKGLSANELVFSVPSLTILKDKENVFFKKNIHLLNNLNEYSNPILLFAKINLSI